MIKQSFVKTLYANLCNWLSGDSYIVPSSLLMKLKNQPAGNYFFKYLHIWW